MTRKKKLLSIYGFCLLIGISILVFNWIRPSFGLLENDSKLLENTEYVYYIEVSYNGKDENYVMSNSSTTASVYSDYIYIQDRIPEGLSFLGFVTTSNGTIGAVKQDNSGEACGGSVVDGVSGLIYDEGSKTISFKIYNLQAGCKISVGIRVKTPYLFGTTTRMDFYNIAYGSEGEQSQASNVVHTYIGLDLPDMYKVTYQYEGDIPENAPELPTSAIYASGSKVSLATEPIISGYVFEGWQTTVEINDGVFTMPSQDVSIVGRFSKTPTYTVHYKIDGIIPENYISPDSQEYNAGSTITVDSLQPGTELLGYRFLGWKTDDVDVSDGNFVMPNNDVTFIGEFEKIVYTLSYEYRGLNIPTGAEEFLPDPVEYSPGELISLPNVPEYDSYTFLGWSVSEPFTMPNQDTVIYGEWEKNVIPFSLTMQKRIIDSKSYYQLGDVINIEIEIFNPNASAVTDIRITNNQDTFLSGTGYEVLNQQNVLISSLESMQSVVIKARYTVTQSGVIDEVIDTTEIVGALMGNEGEYRLNISDELIKTSVFPIANISLQLIPLSVDDVLLDKTEFSLCYDSQCKQVLDSGLSFSKLEPNQTYYLKETKTQSGYVLLKDILTVQIGDDGTIEIPNYVVDNQDGHGTLNIYLKEINILPNTGGIGIFPFVIGGFSLILFSCGGYLFYLKKRRSKKK